MAREYVTVIGAGMMGSGIAAMAALAGHKVILVDITSELAEKGKEKAIECIKLRRDNELATCEEAEQAFGKLFCCGDIEESVKDSFIVIEAIVEKLEIKQQLFKQLDELLPPEVPICSNTSGLRITEISALCEHYPERTLTTHFWLPAHLVPLVEVVMGDKTEESVAVYVRDELKKWKKSPVIVRKDLPGQLANRVFQAIIRESIDIVASGLASAEDVDTAIAAGMAMRFPVWGPLTHLDAIGTDLGLSVQETVLPDICAEKHANTYIREMVARNDLGSKTGKGFYDWNERSIDEALATRDAFIIETCKVLNKLGK